MKHKLFRRTLIVALGMVLAMPALASEKAGSAGKAGSMTSKPYKVGDTVQSFTLKDAHGNTHSLSDHLGKDVIVLEYWNLNCPVSRSYNERMKALHAEFSDKGVVFFGIDSNAPNKLENVRKYVEEKGIAYPILRDEGNIIADKFGANVTPEIFVIGKDKKIHYHGAVDDSQNEAKVEHNYLAQALNAVLSGEEPEQKVTKAFGCTIKRAN